MSQETNGQMESTATVDNALQNEVKVGPGITARIERVRLTKSGLLKDKYDGLTIKEQADKYGLSMTDMRAALKQANISVRAKKKPGFILEDDTNGTATTDQSAASNGTYGVS